MAAAAAAALGSRQSARWHFRALLERRSWKYEFSSTDDDIAVTVPPPSPTASASLGFENSTAAVAVDGVEEGAISLFVERSAMGGRPLVARAGDSCCVGVSKRLRELEDGAVCRCCRFPSAATGSFDRGRARRRLLLVFPPSNIRLASGQHELVLCLSSRVSVACVGVGA